jgi:hypothetical protein
MSKNLSQPDDKNLKTRTSKKFGFLIGGFFILIGFVMLTKSTLGGLLIIFGGLLLLPKLLDLVINKLKSNVLKNKFIFYIIAFILIFIGFGLSSDSIRSENKKEWLSNKSNILSKVDKLISDDSLTAADSELKKYSEFAKDDPEFKKLEEKISDRISAKKAKEGGNLNEQDRNVAEYLKTGARCAGFYSRWGPGSIDNCRQAANYEPFSKGFTDNALKCDAYQSLTWYEATMDGRGGSSAALVEYLKANKSIYDKEYQIGISKNQGSNMDLDTSGKCRDYMNGMRNALSK